MASERPEQGHRAREANGESEGVSIVLAPWIEGHSCRPGRRSPERQPALRVSGQIQDLATPQKGGPRDRTFARPDGYPEMKRLQLPAFIRRPIRGNLGLTSASSGKRTGHSLL